MGIRRGGGGGGSDHVMEGRVGEIIKIRGSLLHAEYH